MIAFGARPACSQIACKILYARALLPRLIRRLRVLALALEPLALLSLCCEYEVHLLYSVLRTSWLQLYEYGMAGSCQGILAKSQGMLYATIPQVNWMTIHLALDVDAARGSFGASLVSFGLPAYAILTAVFAQEVQSGCAMLQTLSCIARSPMTLVLDAEYEYEVLTPSFDNIHPIRKSVKWKRTHFLQANGESLHAVLGFSLSAEQAHTGDGSPQALD